MLNSHFLPIGDQLVVAEWIFRVDKVEELQLKVSDSAFGKAVI